MLFASGATRSLPSFALDAAADGKTTRRRACKAGMTALHAQLPGACHPGGPPVDVTTWRRCRLLEAGFPERLATRLAADGAVDLHALLQLVDRGCPPKLAARILSPVTAYRMPS